MKTLFYTIVFSFLITAVASAQETSTLRLEARNDSQAQRVFPSQSIGELSLGLIQNEHAVFRFGDLRQVAAVGSLIGSESLLVMAIQPKRLLVKTATGYSLIEPDASGKLQTREARPAYLQEELRQDLENVRKGKTIERPTPRNK